MLARGNWLVAAAIVGLLVLCPNTLNAEELSPQALAAKDAFRPLTDDDLAAAQANLDAAAQALEARFARAGDTAEGWRAYLKWQELIDTLEVADGPKIETLAQTHGLLSRGHEGLGLTCFTDLRQSIRQYVSVSRAIEQGGLDGQYGKVLEGLAARLASHAAAPNGEDAAVIAESLRWLSDARQVPELVQSIRSASLWRNFHARVSAGMIQAAMGQEIDETLPVRDNILGTSITGTGHMVGHVAIELVPSHDRAEIMMVLSGTTTSDTVGRNGPVLIYANGSTELTARKKLFIDGRQISTLASTASATTHSHIRSICARNGSRLIEKIAWKRAGKQKHQAECIASRHAEQQLRERFDDEVQSMVGPANVDIEHKLRRPLVDRGLYPAELAYATTRDDLEVSVLQAGPFDLGATTAPPEAAAGADVDVRLHESMVNNFMARALGGMLLREQSVQKAATDLLGELPAELESEPDSQPWGITFQPRRPVWVAFSDDQFTLSIRGRNFYEGEKKHPGMDVTVTYRIVRDGETLKAVRQGELAIFPPGFDPEAGKQLSTQQTVIRRLLQRRLGKVFQEELVPEDLVLPNQWRRAGELKIVRWAAQDGWLALSLKRTGKPAPAEDPATEDAVAQVR